MVQSLDYFFLKEINGERFKVGKTEPQRKFIRLSLILVLFFLLNEAYDNNYKAIKSGVTN